MTDDAMRRFLEEQERMRKLMQPYEDMKRLQQQINPLQDQLKNLGLDSAAMKFIREEEERRKLYSGLPEVSIVKTELEKMERHRQLRDGPVGELWRLGLFDQKPATQSVMDKVIEEHARYEELFRLPAVSELGALAHIAMTSDLTQMVMGTEDKLKSYLEAMKSPWLQIENVGASALGLSELVSIGRGIDIYSPYDENFVRTLRSELGDWRDISIPSSEVLVNPISRSEFYASHGLNSKLTDFTPSAFRDGLRIARLKSDEQIEDVEDVDIDEQEFRRAMEAFALLRRFEIALRRFFEEVMEEEFGAKWKKQQLPSGMLANWEEKKSRDTKAGPSDLPVIHYADFSDYRVIIEKSDNWERVFKHFFNRKHDIVESFNRLHLIRIATMHARVITNDDELLIRVETKRVLASIDRKSEPKSL